MIRLIHVTKNDIKNGKRNCPGTCAVALACRRVLSKDYEVLDLQVGNDRVIFDYAPLQGPGSSARVTHTKGYVPKYVNKFIKAFDETVVGKGKLKPMFFILNLKERPC